MSSKNSGGKERRRHPRLPVLEGVIEPISVSFEAGAASARKARGPRGEGRRAGKSQPAILTDLSAGGMSLLMFLEPPRARRLEMRLQLPGLDRIPVEGKVVRVNEKGQTYSVGIAFTRISRKHQQKIIQLAQDHLDCETRIALKLPEACVPTCTYHDLCAKAQKGPYWKR